MGKLIHILFLALLYSSCSVVPTTGAIDVNASTSNAATDSSLNGVTALNGTASGMPLNPGFWQITLTWTNETVASSYTVKRSEKTGAATSPDQTYENVKSGVVIPNLSSGTKQYFVVVSTAIVNNVVTTATSTEFSLEIPSDSFTQKPGTFTMSAVAGDKNVTISWTEADRSSFYVIQKGTKSQVYTKVVSQSAKSPYIDSDLTNGQTLYYIVLAVNSAGTTSAASEVAVTPGVLSNVTAVAGDAKVTISWGTLPSAVSYSVLRSTSSTGPFQILRSMATSPYVDLTVVNGTQYFYVVSTTVASGDSLPSNTVNATPGPAPGVFNVTAQSGDSNVLLTWTDSTHAEFYTVQYGTSPGSFPNVFTNSGTSPQLVNGLTNGTLYYFRVTASNSIATTNASSDVSATPLAVSFGQLTASPGLSKITLHWGAFPNATSYNIQRSATGLAGSFTTLQTTSSLSYVDSAVQNGIPYYYIVTAVTLTGSVDSSIVSATPVDFPGAFSVTGVEVSDSTVALSWSSSSDAASYTVKYGTSSGFYPHVLANSVSPKSISGLTNGTTYYFLVVAINPAGTSNASEVSAIPVPVPGAPTNIVASPANAQVLLSWVDGAYAVSYNIMRSTSASGPFTTVGTSNNTLYTDNTVTNGTPYYYVITAVNAAGTTDSAPPVSVTPLDLPGAFTVSASLLAGDVTLTWSNSVDATSYSVDYYTDPNNISMVNASSNATSPFVVSGLTSGSIYYFRVTATNIYGSTAANDVSVPIGVSLNVSSVAENNSYILRWDPVPGASSYTVQFGTGTTTFTSTINNAQSGLSYNPSNAPFFKVIANTSSGTLSTTGYVGHLFNDYYWGGAQFALTTIANNTDPTRPNPIIQPLTSIPLEAYIYYFIIPEGGSLIGSLVQIKNANKCFTIQRGGAGNYPQETWSHIELSDCDSSLLSQSFQFVMSVDPTLVYIMGYYSDDDSNQAPSRWVTRWNGNPLGGGGGLTLVNEATPANQSYGYHQMQWQWDLNVNEYPGDCCGYGAVNPPYHHN